MARSLFLFDMTFWLYLASLTLYVAYMFARRPAMALAPAGHPAEDFDERDGALGHSIGAGGHAGDGVRVDGQYCGAC